MDAEGQVDGDEEVSYDKLRKEAETLSYFTDGLTWYTEAS